MPACHKIQNTTKIVCTKFNGYILNTIPKAYNLRKMQSFCVTKLNHL